MDVLITGVDLLTAVGASAETTYFAVRAGLSRFTETGAVNRKGAPRVAAVLPGFSHSRNEERLVTMGVESAMRAVQQAEINGTARLVAILCLPGSPRPDSSTSVDRWVSMFSRAFEPTHSPITVRAFADGAAAIGLAVQDALISFDRGHADAALIGGADSWLPLRTLRWLEDTQRLKIGRRPDGLIAGEAAGFIVLESPRRRAGRRPPLARITAATVTHEPGHWESDLPCLSTGYTEAILAAMRDGGFPRSPSVVVSDLNGESYKAKEWAVAETRALPSSPEFHLHPADCFGDVGTMSGICQLTIAAVGLSRGEWRGPVMVVAGSDGSARTVIGVDAVDRSGSFEPALDWPFSEARRRVSAVDLSARLVEEHVEEAGFLQLQRRLGHARGAEPWSARHGHDRRHAWHLLALAALSADAASALVSASQDPERPPEDRAAAVAALALARSPLLDAAIQGVLRSADNLMPALIDAIDDLPVKAGEPVRRHLREIQDERVRGVAEALLVTAPVNEDVLLNAISHASPVEARHRVIALLVSRRSNALRTVLASSRLTDLLPPETVAWAAACLAMPDASRMALALDLDEMTPRVLTALGGAGYLDAVDVLLRFVNDPDQNRADAAAGSLAAISGVDLVDASTEDEATSETWCRSLPRWTTAMASVMSKSPRSSRLVRGSVWSPQQVSAVLADPTVRNGVRSSLASVGPFDGNIRTRSYYWLQSPTSIS